LTLKNDLLNGFNEIINRAGAQLRIRYFTPTIGSVWDDEFTLAQSGNDLWTSGVIMPLNNRRRSEESVLLEQGKLIDSDKKLYVNGSLTFTSGNVLVDVMLGSATENKQIYTTIPLGGITPEVEDTKIYKKQFLRRLTNGSLN